jgi:hypothetical protein
MPQFNIKPCVDGLPTAHLVHQLRGPADLRSVAEPPDERGVGHDVGSAWSAACPRRARDGGVGDGVGAGGPSDDMSRSRASAAGTVL